ncbi:hypothetical protein HispidOSU_018492 [Sigmodon hispidus]
MENRRHPDGSSGPQTLASYTWEGPAPSILSSTLFMCFDMRNSETNDQGAQRPYSGFLLWSLELRTEHSMAYENQQPWQQILRLKEMWYIRLTECVLRAHQG